MWFRRVARQWVVVGVALVGGAFVVADGVGWIKMLTGRQPAQQWVYLGTVMMFAATAIYHLVKLQAQIDESGETIRLAARPGFLAVNYPLPSEQPLSRDEVSINTTIYFQVWTDIDIDTANLVLNVVGIRRRRWWQPWKLFLPKSKRMFGIRIEGQDDARYRKPIRRSGAQPFEDHATFKWRGKSDIAGWGDSFLFELALETGSPRGVWRAIVDPRLFERGVTTAL